MSQLTALALESYACAVEKGWYDQDKPFPEEIALIHSELSEALESWRNHEQPIFDHDGKPEGWGIELADALIRILNTAAHLDLDIEQAVETKIAYNWTRSYRHGGKRI